MELYVKNMVCPRCILAVKNVLKEIKADVKDVQLGKIILNKSLKDSKLKELNKKLNLLGFELLSDKKAQEVNKIKSIIIDKIHHQDGLNRQFSELLSRELHKDYTLLSKLFSSTEGITIEQYIILQKIEKVKELLTYNELSLKEIAYKLDYSSSAHLSAQFKKTIGLSPTEFKKQTTQNRKSLDHI